MKPVVGQLVRVRRTVQDGMRGGAPLPAGAMVSIIAQPGGGRASESYQTWVRHPDGSEFLISADDVELAAAAERIVAPAPANCAAGESAAHEAQTVRS